MILFLSSVKKGELTPCVSLKKKYNKSDSNDKSSEDRFVLRKRVI